MGFWVIFWLCFLPQGLSRGRVFKWEFSRPWEAFPLFPVFDFPLGIPGWIYRKHLDGTGSGFGFSAFGFLVGFFPPGLEQRKNFQMGPFQAKLGKLFPSLCFVFLWAFLAGFREIPWIQDKDLFFCIWVSGLFLFLFFYPRQSFQK